MDELLKPRDVARCLRTTTRTLASWRASGHPKLPWVRVNGRILYRREDVERLIAANLQTP